MLPSNTDDGDCVGPHGPSRRSGRSHCMSSSIWRPVQNSATYPQLAKQTSKLCALGVLPEMRPSVFGCKEPRTERYTRSYPLMVPCSGAAGQLRASARETVKGLIPRKMETPMVGWRLGAVHEDVGLAVKRCSFGWKRNVLITHTGVPYKVYNSVPLVLYLKPFRTTGCTN